MLECQHADGSVGPPQRGVADYHKVPTAFFAEGANEYLFHLLRAGKVGWAAFVHHTLTVAMESPPTSCLKDAR